jgi:hypothetical protein
MMYDNMVQAYNTLKNPSLTRAYARRKALAYLRNALWSRYHAPHDYNYYVVTLAIDILERPQHVAPTRNERVKTILEAYFIMA